MGLRERVSPALALLFLSPFIGECLSGSSPPLEFFNPSILLLLLAMYGSGAILCREAVFRWRKGLPSLILLGCAYGIAEEALAVKSFFDPGWMDIGVLGSYGRLWGVNWVWALSLTVYHAVFSISIPVALVTLICPKSVGKPWVGRRGLALLFSAFVLVEALCSALLTPYRPPAPQYLAALLVALALVPAALHFPPKDKSAAAVGAPAAEGAHTLSRPRNDACAAGAGPAPGREGDSAKRSRSSPAPGRRIGPGGLFTLGALWTLSFFFLLWAGPHIIPSAPALGAAMIFFLGLSALLLAGKGGWGSEWSPREKLALVAGSLVFLIFLGFLHELRGLFGMSLVSISASVFLWWAWMRVGAGAPVRGGDGGPC